MPAVPTMPRLRNVVGAAGRQSFAVIGDMTNTAARLMADTDPGRVVVARTTWEALGSGRDGDPLGPVRVKGKRAPVDARMLRRAGPV